jgi:cell wall-associated NlpC family hydrolase
MTINAVGSTPTSRPVGSGQRPHRHDHTKMFEPAAKALGMSTDDLETQLKAGQILSDVASAQGVSPDDLVAAIAADLEAHKPEGAPALSHAQATQMATAMVQRKPGEGRGADAFVADPSALAEKLMWSATSAIGQSPSSDAGADAPTTGRLVDEYA